MKLRKFIRGEQFYFQMLNDDGEVIFDSQAYQAKDARDNGIESVKKNMGNSDRYERLSEGGNSYFILKAGNNQEIARSRAFTDTAALEAAMSYAQGGKSAKSDGGAAYGTDGRDDDYKPLAFYESNGSGVQEGFDSFAADGESYFSYSLDGTIYMISEGYKSDAARDNGVGSVERNMTNDARYQRQVHPNGKHYFNLRAGNNQEIATSRWFDSEGEMNGIITRLTGGAGAAAAADGDLVAANRVASVSIDAPPPATGDPAPKKKRKKRTTEKKPKKEKVYLSDGNYHFNDVTYQLFRSGNDKHYFTFKNAEGKTILLNSDVRGFDTPEQGEAKIAQVLKYGPTESNYEGKTTKNGKYYFYLKGDEGKNIAKSFFFNTQEDMQVAIGSLLGSVAETAAPETAAPAATPPVAAKAAEAPKPTAERKDDDYLACKVYLEHYGHVHDGLGEFSTFKHENEYYFAWVGEGLVIMRSEGYTSESARDNGIASVKKNRDIEERWSLDEKMGYYFSVLKAGNHQEIARSCPYKDQASAKYWWPSEIQRRQDEAAAKEEALHKAANEAAALHAAAAPEPEPEAPAPEEKPVRKDDDYLACREYEAHISDKSAKHADFITFEQGGEHFFAWVADGKIVMRSERYASAAARDNGIESVIKNRTEEKRFSLDEKAGHYFTVLKAGNHQEIARSCPHKEKGAAMYWYPSEIAKRDAAAKKKAEEEAAAKKKAEEEAAAKKKAEEEAAAKKKAEEEAAAKKKAEEEAAAKKKAEVAAAAAAAAVVAAKAAKREDDYLHCKYYKGHERSKEHSDFSLFEEDGEHYFAMLDNDGEVVLRSEGYKSEKGRDNGIQSVIKNREIDGRYSVDEKGGMYYVVLKAGNNQEIGRSCPYKDKGKASGFIAPAAAVATAVAAAAIPKAEPKAAPADKEDDYLACKKYEGKKVNDKVNNVALFKHDEDGQYYFALYDKDGDVKLRSEGFTTAKERDEELSGVLKYHDNKDMYKRKEKGVYYMDILYDKTGREVGRSCLKKKVAAAPVAAAAATAVAAAVVAPKPKPEPKKVVAPVTEKVAAAPVATSSGGGFKWWWLLPLLLLPLLWFLLKGCGDEKVVPPPPPPKVEAPAPTPAPEPVKEVTPPPAPEPAPAPVVAGCNCGEKDIAIFNIPQSASAKSVSRLGTNPEFGNSHDLSPAQFYQKLSDRHASSSVDRAYLNYVFRSMGYRNGFSGASAGLFSNVTLDRGQKGLLGLGEQHHYEYSALNTSDRDRQAFKIRAANGCDVHFMKTCGNYMFFCD